jgi:hypothetical protein
MEAYRRIVVKAPHSHDLGNTWGWEVSSNSGLSAFEENPCWPLERRWGGPLSRKDTTMKKITLAIVGDRTRGLSGRGHTRYTLTYPCLTAFRAFTKMCCLDAFDDRTHPYFTHIHTSLFIYFRAKSRPVYISTVCLKHLFNNRLIDNGIQIVK